MRKILLIAVSIVILIITLFVIRGSIIYKNVPPPKIASANSPKELITKLSDTKEFFTGSIQVKYIDREKNVLEVKMQNNSVGDDSSTADEYIYKAVKKDAAWHVVETKLHWKCRNYYFFTFWTTQTCP